MVIYCSNAGASKGKSSFQFLSVASQFRDSLASLMESIHLTQPNCIYLSIFTHILFYIHLHLLLSFTFVFYFFYINEDIRCIKPNAGKKPLTFDKVLVLQQLRCGGVLEQLRISRAGYPSRLPYANVMRRYNKESIKRA